MHKIKIFLTAAAFILSMIAVQAQTPGGSQSVTFAAWLTSDSYSNGVWTNLIGNGVGDFTQPTNWTTKTAPYKMPTGTNFHPAVQFRPGSYSVAVNRLLSRNGVNLTASDAFTFILVYKASSAGYTYQNILNFAGGTAYDLSNYSLGYNSSSTNVLYMGWPTTRRTLGAVPFGSTAMVTVDNNNGQVTANGIRHYVNGSQVATATSASGAVNNQIVLGASYYDLAGNGERGVNADIQEVIMLKRPKATFPFLDNVNSGNDMKKIHTYLAIKYGISMNTDYMATDGTVVWNNAANQGYNNFVFGIGRDNGTNLYQKQSASASNGQTILFIGNKLETVNSQNSGTLNDREFLLLGSNGVTSVQPVTIPDDAPYENENIDAGTGLNFQSGMIYKAQLTNLSAITVKLKLTGDYLYAFVSKNANFTPAQTRIYPVNSNKEATVYLDTEYKYIRYAGFSAGPGGVNSNLRLWLRADDEGALTIESLSGTDPKLANFPGVSAEGNLAVQEWNDPMRGHKYTWAMGSQDAGVHRIPVYEPHNLMMNYHPAVRFWGSANSYTAYLSNSNSLLPTAHPAGEEHTAYFVTANNFNTNAWIYNMMFCSSANLSDNRYNGPGYGVERISNGNLVGRFRASNYITGTVHLFDAGATSISGYYQYATGSTSTGRMKFRFNGRNDSISSTFSWSGMGLNHPSIIGSGYNGTRTIIGAMSEVIIFEKALTVDETRRLESYLAIKYGVTLYPSNTATRRFDYTLSNGTKFWPGDTQSGKYVTFYNNISAVIRDDAARLHNNQSHSTNAGTILHMGVAGKKLGSEAELGELENNMEVVVWGSNSSAGLTTVSKDPCADFERIFNKIWMVRKMTENGRPIAMLVGAQDNSNNNLGSSVGSGIRDMYAALGSGNDVSLVVADSPEKLTPGNSAYGDFKSVVSMKYIDGEQQCAYVFSDSITYVTFACKPNRKGCYGTVQFPGTKTFDWRQWTRTNYNITGSGAKTLTKPSMDLDDDVTVSTKIVYDNGISASANYPRVTANQLSSPLEIQRIGGMLHDSKVVTTITFNTPVIPEFYISGLDSRSGRMDAVTISAKCPGGVAIPALSYATSASNANYKITGNRATVYRTRSASATDAAGKVFVSFENGVTELVIEYTITGRSVSTTAQYIYISPITLSNVLPVPIVNEDGLSFTKQAKPHSITTCDPVEYIFRIRNTNMLPKYVNFIDVLPANMKWKVTPVALDTVNAENSGIRFNTYAGTNTLTIDNLYIPCVSEISFRATAMPDRDAPSDTYYNNAEINYELIKNNISSFPILYSQDAETLEPYTPVDIAWSERKDTVHLSATVSSTKYAANREITVTFKVNNPNPFSITDMFLDLAWDAGFKYVPNSWNGAAGSSIITDSFNAAGGMSVAGNANGSQGFTLAANGETVFTFKLLAPTAANLEYEYDINGNPTTEKATLNIFYNYGTEMDNPCIIESLNELSGQLRVPYGQITHIITNQHTSTKISK